MELITTHVAADFDCLGSLVAARRLYPDPVLAFAGSVEGAVRRYLEHPPAPLEITPLRRVDRRRISRFVLVDVSSLDRVGPVGEWIRSSPGTPVDIYDHHPAAARAPGTDGGLPGACRLMRPVGATSTLLADLLRERGLSLSASEATLLATGICEDTGFLKFATTTPVDVQALEWLKAQGADLAAAERYLRGELGPDQRRLLDSLRRAARPVPLPAGGITLSVVDAGRYVPDAATAVHQLIDEQGLHDLVALIGMGRNVLMVARSRGGRIDMGSLAARFGGGGHPAAASATLRNQGVEEAAVAVTAALGAAASPPRPRSGGGRAAPPGPGGAGGHPAAPSRAAAPGAEEEVGAALETALGPTRVARLRRIGGEAQRRGGAAYLVGGVVRDLLLGRRCGDLDVMVEGDAMALARLMVEREGGRVRSHPRFGTASWMLPDGERIDLASARREWYQRPGALPRVAPGTLADDLSRRDFTINAMAVRLAPDWFGRLVDPHGGRLDLRRRRVRALHAGSYADDPTRALRAVRFATRLRFRIDPRDARCIRAGAARGEPATLSGARLWKELCLLLREERAAAAIGAMERLGLLAPVHPGLRPDRKAPERLRRLEKVLRRADLGYDLKNIDSARVRLLALALPLRRRERRALGARLELPAAWRRILDEDPTGAAAALERLACSRMAPRDSRIFAICRKLSPESALVALAAAQGRGVRRLLARYWSRLQGVRRRITGHDLIRLGVPPGPAFSRILEKVARARVDGRVRTPEEELALARRLAGATPGTAEAAGRGAASRRPGKVRGRGRR